MKIKLSYRMLLRDEKGRLVKDTGLMPSHSYVIQFLELIRAWLAGASGALATDVDGAESKIYPTMNQNCETIGRVDCAALSDLYGLVVGTNSGSTPEGNENYKLDTKILHSITGEAGKLNYRAVTFVAAQVVAGNVDLDISRPFINETVATITVKEIGIICKQTVDTKYHLLMRDVVADFDVLSGYTLTVVYTLRTTV